MQQSGTCRDALPLWNDSGHVAGAGRQHPSDARIRSQASQIREAIESSAFTPAAACWGIRRAASKARLRTCASSPLRSSDARRPDKQRDRRGHQQRAIALRANRSPASPERRHRSPSNAIVRRRLLGRLLLGESDRAPRRVSGTIGAIALSPLHSSGRACDGRLPSWRSTPGVESSVPARATVRVGSKAEPRSGSKAL